MPSRSLPDRRTALATCAFAAITAIVCVGLLIATALVPAPPALVPLFAFVCVGCPILAAWHLPAAVAAVGRNGPLAELRRSLDELPETRHPLGL